MHIVKIENFERAKPGQSFPWFRHLNPKESEEIREALMGKLSLGADTDGLTLVQTLLDRSGALEGYDAGADKFALLPVFEQLGLQPEEHVYINWHRFDDIDLISLKDLVSFFDDIWYPAADDLDIFDPSLNWILSVTHSGQIRILKLGSG